MKKRNKYVDFVSDEHFLNCVEYVCGAYPQENAEINIKKFTKNSLDLFKTIFDIMIGKLDFDKWRKAEEIRQADKTISNKVGDFHQMLLGGVEGWEDLKRGHPLGIDLKKEDDTITPLKISIIEPDETNLFTITLETFGEDKLPKIFKGSFYNTINNLEKINKRLSNLNLKSINILINLSCYLDKEDNITYSCSKNVSMSLKTISCNSKNFTDIEPLVKKCLKKWRNKFI